MTLLHELLTQAFVQEKVIITEDWGQGRSTFGGIVVSIALARMYGLTQCINTPLHCINVSFVGPVEPNEEIYLSAEILRQGKFVTQVEIKVIQQVQVKAVVLASLGVTRSSIINIEASASEWQFAAASTLPPLPYVKGVLPNFIQHIDMRWAQGGYPCSGATHADFSGYMRLKSTPVDVPAWVNLCELVALIDAWPPSVFPLLSDPATASSLSWYIDLFTPLEQPHNAFWSYQVKTNYAKDGYTHSEARIWSEQGKLVAISRQTVTVFV